MYDVLIRIVSCFIFNPTARRNFKKRNLHKASRQINSQFAILNAKLDYLTAFMQATTDITNLPPAHGNLRLIQQSSAKLLALVDLICRENGLHYWMHYGTLIGAMRHQGFIPWDDDIDICMMRPDYEKFIAIITRLFKNSDFSFNVGDALKIFYQNTPARVDIFPFDQFYDELSTDQAIKDFWTRNHQVRNKIYWDWKNLLPDFPDEIPSCSKTYTEITDLIDSIIMQGKKPVKNGTVFRGCECIKTDMVLYRPEWIFPTSDMYFEGYKLMAPHNPNFMLMQRWGSDCYNFPRDMAPKHSHAQTRFVNSDTITKMQEFLLQDNQKILNKLSQNQDKK